MPGPAAKSDPSLSGLRRASALGLDAITYTPHWLHREERAWPESNCYTDLWIEILHAAGHDPIPALGFCLASDFEGDQWTFFKYPLVDLVDLYGVDTQELSIWKAPLTHALEQARRGRIVLMEVDSHYLPDVGGTSYRREHTKTTIGIETVDLDARRLGYFHNGGYYALAGDDFDGVFRVNDPWTPQNPHLLPYTELVKLHAPAPSPEELVERALPIARRWLARAPRTNPFQRYTPRLIEDLAWLSGQPLDAFHLYAFASIRQFGAAFELSAVFLRWLAGQGRAGLDDPAGELHEIAQGAKALQFKLARAVNAKRAFDPTESLTELGRRWEAGMGALRRVLGGG